MISVENECVGCTSMGLPCLGAACPNRNVTRYYCDKCGEEIMEEDYYEEELCPDCFYLEYGVNVHDEVNCNCCDGWFSQKEIIRTEDGDFCELCYEDYKDGIIRY